MLFHFGQAFPVMKNAIYVFCCILFLLFGNRVIGQKKRSAPPKNNSGTDSLLIKNVILLSREDTAGDVRISLLIVNGVMQFVTQDNVFFGRGTRALDGNGGFLMGNIAIGEMPGFVVLDENPRKNFDVLLNTDKHIRFAMNKGVIVTNRLPTVTGSASNPAWQKRNTWSAYQAPPMAVPISYYSSRKWNKFNTKFISGLFNGVIALDHLNWISQDENSKQQVGELESTSVGAVRAIRFGLVGTLNFKKPWVYTVFFTNNSFDRGYDAGSDNRFMLYDLRLDIPLPAGLNLSVGKQKEPISMERLMPLMFLPMEERQAAADAFLPARNYGVLVNGALFNSRGTFAAGIFKNVFDSDTTFSKTPTQVTWRVTGLPFISEDESNLVHLALGVRHSTADLPVALKADAEFFQAPAFLKTDAIAANRQNTYLVETYWRRGPLLVGGELIRNRIKSESAGDPKPWGWNVGASWALTGEMRKYRKRSGIFDPLPVAKPVGHGGWGALELCGRYSSIDFTDAAISAGNMRTFSLGANWWPNRHAHFGFNYRLISTNKMDMTGFSSGVNFRLMLILD